MTRVLRKLKLDEVSSVTRAANPHARIKLMKRDGTPDFQAIFRKRTPRFPPGLERLTRYHNDALPSLKASRGYVTSALAEERARRRDEFNDEDIGAAAEPAPNLDEEPDALDEDAFDPQVLGDEEQEQMDEEDFALHKSHVISQLADLLCEAAGTGGRAAALRFLTTTPVGHSLVHRLAKAHATNKQRKEKQMSFTTEEKWSAIAKASGGLEAICKHVIEAGETSLSEHELTNLLADGVERNPGESREQAFSRAFCAMDERGLAMRKSVAIAKGAFTA